MPRRFGSTKAWMRGTIVLIVVLVAGALLLPFGAQALLTARLQILCSRTGNEMETDVFEGEWSATCEFTKAGSAQTAEEVAARLERDGWTRTRSGDENYLLFERRTLLLPSHAVVTSTRVSFHM